MKTYDKQYINGKWQEGTGESLLENRNPYTGEVLYTYQSASTADVDQAYQAAQEVQKDWGASYPVNARLTSTDS